MDAAQRELGPPASGVASGSRLRSLPSEPVGQTLEDVWDRHGMSVYAVACALLGDEAAATLAVTRAMQDLAGSSDLGWVLDERRTLARHVYHRSQELLEDTSSPEQLPPAMRWVAQLAPLQRACVTLCCFGGHTHREAAVLLDVPPMTVAELLTAGLRELSDVPAGH